VCIARWHPPQLPADVEDEQLIRDDLSEMHVCVGEQCADFTAQKGDAGTLTFLRGSPTGGDWQGRKPGLAPPSGVAPEIAPRFSGPKSPTKPHKSPSLSRM